MKLLTEGGPSSEATAVAIAVLEVREREGVLNVVFFCFVCLFVLFVCLFVCLFCLFEFPSGGSGGGLGRVGIET